MTVCPSCRATACEELFHRFLALEFNDPAYGAVHHLTVPAYMLQHPHRLSQEGWRQMRATLHAFLVEGRTPQAHRAALRDSVSSSNRTTSLKNGPHQPLPAAFTWSQTIAAVDHTTPQRYRQTIEQWARAVLSDAQSI